MVVQHRVFFCKTHCTSCLEGGKTSPKRRYCRGFAPPSQVPQPTCSWNPDTCQLGNLTQIFTKAIHMIGDGILQCDPISCQEYQTQFHDSSPLVQSGLGICNCKNSIYLFYPGYSWLRRPSSSHNDSYCCFKVRWGHYLRMFLQLLHQHHLGKIHRKMVLECLLQTRPDQE